MVLSAAQLKEHKFKLMGVKYDLMMYARVIYINVFIIILIFYFMLKVT